MYQNNLLNNLPIRVSVIIPTLNEKEHIQQIIEWISLDDKRLLEIIIVDGGSTDQTVSIAKKLNTKIVRSKASRAIQMNEGARVAKGNILYFVHADTRPPKSYLDDIDSSIKSGFSYGCYRSIFDTNSKQMKMNAFFTRFNCLMFRGGDQSLYVTRSFFDLTGGFDGSKEIMEEYYWLRKAKGLGDLTIIPKGCLISTRKYDKNSYFRINLANLFVFMLFYLGISSKTIAETYRKLLH